MKNNIIRRGTPVLLALLTLLPPLALLSACDRSVDEKLSAQASAEKSLEISPTLFATKFNRSVRDVLEDRKDDNAARMAPLYAIDVTQLHKGGEKHTFQTQVGPAQTSLMGSLAKDGDLKTIGVLLASRTEGARDEFFLCAETVARIVTDSDKAKLPDQLKRLVNNAINNPGQRMTIAVGQRLLSAEIIQQGLMFQVERSQ
ncbi:aldehyde dehydrogenase [Herbaspirillum lusitanum]|uniref:aldehyde dehydrogenase n=1 Tax=Herbaspirillum lusitanum TaxID=213312 RepID=UPI002236F218|nr:aldehyde dehydrogenase [Herbaspirillum lusitanum]MCW5297456.1 aldehyde dehydrogenase [Herbaspirillum lusitanum]